jgi:hypothetical protein
MSGLKAIWVDAYHLELYEVGTPGWYAFDKGGKAAAAVMGPFTTREECDHGIATADRGVRF